MKLKYQKRNELYAEYLRKIRKMYPSARIKGAGLSALKKSGHTFTYQNRLVCYIDKKDVPEAYQIFQQLLAHNILNLIGIDPDTVWIVNYKDKENGVIVSGQNIDLLLVVVDNSSKIHRKFKMPIERYELTENGKIIQYSPFSGYKKKFFKSSEGKSNIYLDNSRLIFDLYTRNGIEELKFDDRALKKEPVTDYNIKIFRNSEPESIRGYLKLQYHEVVRKSSRKESEGIFSHLLTNDRKVTYDNNERFSFRGMLNLRKSIPISKSHLSKSHYNIDDFFYGSGELYDEVHKTMENRRYFYDKKGIIEEF